MGGRYHQIHEPKAYKHAPFESKRSELKYEIEKKGGIEKNKEIKLFKKKRRYSNRAVV